MNTFNCIKCGESYQEKDVDPYYCELCLKEKNNLAIEVDKKIASTPSKRPQMSELQQFDLIAKEKGGGCHVNIKDLGITL